MNQSFSVFYSGMEFILPKSSVSFHGEYGLVSIYVPITQDEQEYQVLFTGVVNPNFEIIIEFVPAYEVPKIDFFPNGKVVFQYNHVLEDGTHVFNVYSGCIHNKHLKVEDDLQAKDYTVISEKVIKLNAIMSDGVAVSTLYDIEEKIPLTPYYHYIGEFTYNEKYQEEIAEADIFIIDKANVEHRLMFYINHKGEIVSSYEDVNNNKIYDQSIDLSTIIDMVYSDVDNLSR
jgi:hypothetical protein